MLGAMACVIVFKSFGSCESSLIFCSSSLLILMSLKSCCAGWTWFASKMMSNVVLCVPCFVIFGTSLTIPVRMILLPGFVFFSVSGLTRSFLRKMLRRFGWAPPSSCSGTSSSTSPCASMSSLERSLNFPLRPQLQRVGSWNLVSTWRMLRVLPQLGHSKRAVMTWGRTSPLFRTIPSMQMNFLRCLLRTFLMRCVEDGGRLWKRMVNPLVLEVVSSCAIESSAALRISSGSSRSWSAMVGLYSARSGKLTEQVFAPWRAASAMCV